MTAMACLDAYAKVSPSDAQDTSEDLGRNLFLSEGREVCFSTPSGTPLVIFRPGQALGQFSYENEDLVRIVPMDLYPDRHQFFISKKEQAFYLSILKP